MALNRLWRRFYILMLVQGLGGWIL